MPRIQFGEWRPDLPDLSQWAREALNVVPMEESYQPLNSLATVSNALDGKAMGAAWFKPITTDVIKMFAGTSDGLFLLSATTWISATRVAGAYSAPPHNRWFFTQFGSLAIAVNGIDVPQQFDLNAGTNWVSVTTAASSPAGPNVGPAYCATVRDFLVFGHMNTAPNRVQWSGENNSQQWGSNATTQADFQDMPDGGDVTGLVGGEFGLIFQQDAIRRMTYEGLPVVFRLDKIGNLIGCTVPGSVAAHLDIAFCVHKTGFYQIQGGSIITPIGRGKVDRTFWKEFDESNKDNCSAAIDPVRGLYVFAYPAAGSAGTPNRLLIYNWIRQKWSRAFVTTELIFAGASQTSYTLDQLDPFGTLETLPYSLDSNYWAGTASLLLYGFDTNHKSGSFGGVVLPATLDTNEFVIDDGKRAVIRGCRPLIDGGTPQILLGTRENQQNAVAFGAAISVTSTSGWAPLYQSGRYFRLRATMASATVWNNAQGFDDLDFRLAGVQ